jgi:DNA-binding transcriptional regulator YiaG
MPVMKSTPAIRTLRRAMSILGSREELAQYLEVSAEELSNWLRGEAVPPVRPYVAAVDLVSGGAARVYAERETRTE